LRTGTIARTINTIQIAFNGFAQARLRHLAAINIQRTTREYLQRRQNQMAVQGNQAVINGLDALVQALRAQVQNVPLREMNLIQISNFDGTTDPITWIEDFEKAAAANQYTDARKIAVVGARLKSTAADWLRGRQANIATDPVRWVHEQGHNPAEIAQSFRQPFIDHFRDNARIARWQQELDACTQGTETVDRYVCRLRELMRKVDPADNTAEYTKISMFMRGLNPRYKFHVRAASPVQLNNAVDVAKAYELSYNELSQQPVGIVQDPNNKAITALLGEMQTKLEALQMDTQRSPRPNNNNNKPNNRSQSFNQNNNSRECYKCGQPGHIARYCRSGQGYNNNGGNNTNRGNFNNRNSNQNWRGGNNNNNNGNNGYNNNSGGYNNNNHNNDNRNNNWNNNNNNQNNNRNNGNNRQFNQGDFDIATEVKSAIREALNLKD
jgi:hypothetical protein